MMEKNNDLIERYLYAVSNYLPYKNKNDILNELRSIINDMLEERCKDLIANDKDIRVVLAELGTPDEVGAQYGLGKQKALISGIYLVKYRMFLKIILSAVVFGLCLSSFLNVVFNSVDIIEASYHLIGSLISVSLSIVGATTLIFAFLEYKAISLEEFNFETLPPVPKKKEKINSIESYISITINVLITTILLFAPNLIALPFEWENVTISIFNIEYVSSISWLILIIGIVNISADVVKIIDSRYTKKVLFFNILTNGITLAGYFYMFKDFNILTPEFLQFCSNYAISMNYLYFCPLFIAIIILLDSLTCIIKTFKASKD